MGSFRTVTLFSVQAEERQRVSPVVVSLVVHAATAALVSFGVYQAKLDRPIPMTQYKVRHLDLEISKEALRAAIEPPKPHVVHTRASGAHPRMRPPALREIAKVQHGPQTLIQPDVHTKVVLKQKVPVPSVAIWQPVKVAVDKIVAPLPQQEVAMQPVPSLNPPNQAVNLSKVELAPSKFASEKLKLMASTTSPLAVQAPTPTQAAPLTTSRSGFQPTPATVISLSQLSMLNGTVVLPPINETSSYPKPGLIGSGKEKSAEAPGSGHQEDKGSGSEPGDHGSQAGQATGTETTAENGSQLTADRITVPKDGKFGAVVVGDSIAGAFPEVTDVWKGRLAYTVYLHVGLARSWILQYSLPRADDAHNSGQVAKLEAPWPYTIVRPNIQPGTINADALLVHGYVNRAGHFESLSIAFPPDFAEARFVLKTLQQWQFRPATQNGEQARVEVLLIIPEDVSSASDVQQAGHPDGVVRVAGTAASSVYSVAAH